MIRRRVMDITGGKEVKEMTMSCVAAMLEDPHNCVYQPFGDEAVLCVLNHPEQFLPHPLPPVPCCQRIYSPRRVLLPTSTIAGGGAASLPSMK